MTNENNKLSAPMGIEHPSIGKVEMLPLEVLKVAPERFQVRNSEANNYVNKILKQQEELEMVRKLVSVVREGKLLDPVLVWEDLSTKEILVVDGHHRMEAYRESDLPLATPIWVQRVNVEAEAQARKVAFERNSRINLNMGKAEELNHVWLGILTGEVTGSVREIEKEYGVGKSSVGRMREHADAVLGQLRKDVEKAGEQFTTEYVRSNAPLWKKLAEWRESDPSEMVDVNELERKKIDALVKVMAVRFGDDVQVHPDLLLKAFAEFYEQATGNALNILVANHSAGEEHEEF